MVNPACEKCKADVSPEQSLPKVAATGCTVQYSLMTECMDTNGGNIASCRESWDAFRKCFAERDTKAKDKAKER